MSRSIAVLFAVLAIIALVASGVSFLLPQASPSSPQSTTGTGIASSTPSPEASSTGSSSTSTPVPPKRGTGTVMGTVMLGPTCPVERIPPDPQCADKPYQTSIRIYQGASAAVYQTIASDANGSFTISLPEGAYTFTPVGGGGMPPTCRPASVSVTAGQSQQIRLSCDTGIR